LLLGGGLAQAQVAVPPLKSAVTDLTGTLSSSQSQQLEARLKAFSAARGSQVAVLLIPTTKPEAIEQFSIRVAEAWKIGRGGKDDGVILVVAKDDRTLRIEVGYGLEGAIPDAIAKRIIEESIVPKFRQGDFPGGIAAGVDVITKLIEGEKLPPPANRGAVDDGANPDAFFALFVVLMVATTLFNSLFGRLPGAVLSGGAVGIAAWIFFGSLFMALAASVIAAVFGLLRGVPGRGHYGGFGGGGFGGGGGGFGGGGGGFSGGGGGFGGGGASGKW